MVGTDLRWGITKIRVSSECMCVRSFLVGRALYRYRSEYLCALSPSTCMNRNSSTLFVSFRPLLQIVGFKKKNLFLFLSASVLHENIGAPGRGLPLHCLYCSASSKARQQIYAEWLTSPIRQWSCFSNQSPKIGLFTCWKHAFHIGLAL